MTRPAFIPVLVICISLGGCSGFDNILNDPRISVQPLILVWMTPEIIQWNLPLKVENPNPVTLHFSRGNCTLSFAGSKFAERNFSDLSMIPGYDSRVLDVPIQADYPTIAALLSKNPQGDLTVSGFLFPEKEWQKPRIPLYGSAPLTVPQLPIFEKIASHVAKKSRKTWLMIKLKNPNSLPLTVVTVKGYLQVGEQKYPFYPLANPKSIASKDSALIPFKTDLPDSIPAAEVKVTGEIEIGMTAGKMILPLPTLPLESQ